jgi:aspartate aminotransferase
VITDEIYQTLTYGGVVARSIVDVVPDLAGQTVLVSGVAKTYAMTGWRVGWMVAPPEIARAAATLQSYLCSKVNNIAQLAALAALTGPQGPVEAMRQAFARRRTLILDRLRAVPGVEAPTPDGAFYVYADVRGLLGRSWRGATAGTSLEFADLLLDRAGVAAVPGEAFGPSGYLRFSCALGDQEIVEGIDRLAAFVDATG